MDQTVQFLFRDKLYSARIYIDDTEYPIYVFTILSDNRLILEFSDEVSIKTDGIAILPMQLSYPEIDELRIALFSATKTTKEFVEVQEKMQLSK